MYLNCLFNAFSNRAFPNLSVVHAFIINNLNVLKSSMINIICDTHDLCLIRCFRMEELLHDTLVNLFSKISENNRIST